MQQRESTEFAEEMKKGTGSVKRCDRSDGYFYLTDKWLNGRRMYGLYLNVEAAAA